MTAKEILYKNLIPGAKFMQVRNVETMIIKAMEEYAQQKTKDSSPKTVTLQRHLQRHGREQRT